MNATIREKVMAATGRAAAAADWPEHRLKQHVSRRGGTTTDINAALSAYREQRDHHAPDQVEPR